MRRRAATAVGRIADRRGWALLRARPLDADTAVAAATVFAAGQLEDTARVAWFDSLLADRRTATPVAAVIGATPRGTIELELYAGDAPLAVDDVARLHVSGGGVGTEFTRVVPDFVDQQRPVAGGRVLRDEVNRHRLVRGNLSWATAGLDTGTPGYTLGHTPQPHNEGDFTSLGRVVRGMDVVDRIELGDAVTAARFVARPGTRVTACAAARRREACRAAYRGRAEA